MDFLKERYFSIAEMDSWVFLNFVWSICLKGYLCRAICLSEMEVFMMACGAMERGPALAPSTLVMVISTVVCGGMM